VSKYTRISFNESFQEWARTNNVVCDCKHNHPFAFEGHKGECPMVAAASHWKTAGSALYAAMPKKPVTEQTTET
jgi:hypothetical protein